MTTATARGLLLDLGGVVLRGGPEMLAIRAREHPALAGYLARTDVGGPGDAAWRSLLRNEISESAYWAARSPDLGRALGHPAWDTRAFIDWLYHGPGDDWLDPAVVDLMRDTRAAGLALAALTNDLVTFHGQEWVDRQEWLKHFDVVVDASVTGVAKPDPRAYAAGVRAMRLPAEQVVYLDDMPWNVAGGVAAGLQSLEVRYDDRATVVSEARRRLGLD